MHPIKLATSVFLLASFANVYAIDDLPANAESLMPKIKHPIHIRKVPGTESISSNTPLGFTPQQIKVAYGFDSTKVPSQGEGQIIAIVTPFDDPNLESDLNVFTSTFNLPACTTGNGCLTIKYGNGIKPSTTTAGWASETAMDVEWAHATAPAAKIYLVEANSDSQPDLYRAIQMAGSSGANIVSLSFGAPEGAWVTQLKLDQYYNIPGVTFVVASGDNGEGINYPASSPYVIAVGGTTLTTDYQTGRRTSEIAWAGSSGGISTIEKALSPQMNYPLPNNPQQFRGVPDVAFNAGSAIPVYDSIPDEQGQKGWLTVGGTSAAAPQWAGIIALANATAHKNLPVKSLLYSVAKQSYKMSFFDVTQGSNGSCGLLCEAQTNYDYLTGLGTPHTQHLINMLIRLDTIA